MCPCKLTVLIPCSTLHGFLLQAYFEQTCINYMYPVLYLYCVLIQELHLAFNEASSDAGLRLLNVLSKKAALDYINLNGEFMLLV